MNTGTILQILIILHLSGLILMAGTTVVDYLLFKSFWKQLALDKERALGIMLGATNFARLIGIGAALLILTGIGMMAMTNGVFGEQLWFRIKFGLVILLILKGILLGRRLTIKLRKHFLDNAVDTADQIPGLQAWLNTFYLSQLFIFLAIVFLSIFKFT